MITLATPLELIEDQYQREGCDECGGVNFDFRVCASSTPYVLIVCLDCGAQFEQYETEEPADHRSAER